jgi:hypothetical protein
MYGPIFEIGLYIVYYTRNALIPSVKTIVVLTDDKLTRFYFLHLLYAIYYSVTMHLRQDK